MQISSVLRAAQHREIMSTTKQHSLEKKKKDDERHKYKNTKIKQTEGCHWYTVMLKINYTPLPLRL